MPPTALAAAPPPEPQPAPTAATGGNCLGLQSGDLADLGGSFTGTSRDPADWHIAVFRARR
jgi:hypothetical protein